MRNRQWMLIGLTVFSLSSAGCTDYTLFSNSHNSVSNSPNIAENSADQAEKQIFRSQGKPRAAVNINYTLSEKPLSGQPLTVTIQVSPRTDAEQLIVTIQQDAELEWVSGEKRVVYNNIDRDNRLEHTVVIQPLADGLAYIHLFTELTSDGVKQAKVIAIPIKTGNTAPSFKNQTPLQTDADGGLILSMPAEERP